MLKVTQRMINAVAIATDEANRKIAAELNTWTTGPRAGSQQAKVGTHRSVKHYRRTLVSRHPEVTDAARVKL
jgi:hypothetical protein